MKDTNLSRTTTQRAPATFQTRPAGEQTGQMAQAFKRAVADMPTLRNAPTNCMSNGAGKKVETWRIG
jgi:hypothetical protein